MMGIRRRLHTGVATAGSRTVDPLRRGCPRRRRTGLLLAIVVSLAVAGSPGVHAQDPPVDLADCPQWRCSSDRVGTAATAIDSANVAELDVSWSFRTRDRIYAAPSVADGVVFVPSEDHHVYAVDAASGAQRWAFATEGQVWSTPAVADGLVFFGSSDNLVYAVTEADGILAWSAELGGDVAASPAVADGAVYVGSNDGHLYAFDTATGQELWRFRAGTVEPTADHRLSSSPAVADGTVFIGGNDGVLYAVDATTGALRWSYEAAAWIWGGGPTVADGRVYFTSNGISNSRGILYALDAQTGEEVWTSPALNGFATPVVAGDVVVASGYTEIRAVDAADGTEVWSYDPDGWMFVSPFVAGDLAFAVMSGLTQPSIVGPANNGDGVLIALDLATGEVRHEVYYPVVAHAYSSPVVVGEQVFFGTGAHVLHSLSLPGGAAPTEVQAVPTAPPLPYAHRDVLANSIDPGSPAVLRLPGDGVSKSITSNDPRGLNADYYHFKGVTQDDPSGVPDGRIIMADLRGPGVLTNMYMYFSLGPTAISPLGPELTPPTDFGAISPTLAMYVDNSAEPVFDMNGFEFYSGGAGFPFEFPLVGEHSAAFSSHVPVPFTERLLIVRDPAQVDSGFWYDFYYTSFPDDRGVESFDPVRDAEQYQALLDRWAVVSPVPDLPAASAADSIALGPGESVTLLDQQGPGQVSLVNLPYVNEIPSVVTTPSSDPDDDPRADEPLKGVRIQARWDDRSELSVDAPIGDFFGTGFGQAQDYDTLVAGMSTAAGVLPQQWPNTTEMSTLGEGGGVSMYSRWPMPFAEHAEIILTNTLEDTTVDIAFEVVVDEVDVELRDGGLWRDDVEVGYFHAEEFHNSSPAWESPHPDVLHNDRIVELVGRGNYVGHVFNMRTHSFGTGGPNIPWYMEGDCMFFIDNASEYKPDITSTGHEECHDTGAYFQGDINNATAGTTNRELAGHTIFLNFQDEVSIFHYWVGDAIGFQHYFLASIEHGEENTYAGAEQAGVAFYYLEASPPARIRRLAGPTRIETAVAVSEHTHLDPDTVDAVVLARADDYADALAGGPLAAKLSAPILLSESDALPAATAAELDRLEPDRIVLLGREQAIGPEVAAELDARHPDAEVDRHGGADRFETAASIAAELEDTSGSAFVAEGRNADPTRGWPDALSAASYAGFTGRPILLVEGDRLPAATATALATHEITETVVVGGEDAVSVAVFDDLEERAHGPRRVGGADRYETSVAVLTEALADGMSVGELWVATGLDWPDALTAAPAVAAAGSGLALVHGQDLAASPAIGDFLRAQAGTVRRVHLLGGLQAISEEVAARIGELVGNEPDNERGEDHP